MTNTRPRDDHQIFDELRRRTGRRRLSDAELAAQFDRAWHDLSGSVASAECLPEMVIRLTMARLRTGADEGASADLTLGFADELRPAPTFW